MCISIKYMHKHNIYSGIISFVSRSQSHNVIKAGKEEQPFFQISHFSRSSNNIFSFPTFSFQSCYKRRRR